MALKLTIKPGDLFMVGTAVITVEPVPNSSRLSVSISGSAQTTPVSVHDGQNFVRVGKKKVENEDKQS